MRPAPPPPPGSFHVVFLVEAVVAETATQEAYPALDGNEGRLTALNRDHTARGVSIQ